MGTRHLLLWIESPLMAWGYDSKFGRRDTLPFPTKSGITGLLLCALGYSGEQKELLAELAPYGQTIISFVRKIKEKKIAREPHLMDFHMVGSGYNSGNKWQSLHIPKTAEGKPAVGGGTKMTYRYYLQDARFAAIVTIPTRHAESFSSALQFPVYDIYFGRKNCAPTDMVFRGVFNDEKSALEEALKIAQEKNLTEDFRVLEGESEGDVITLNDVPLQFGPVKKYRDRIVTVIPVRE
ncbi:MAG TPA: type I-E CRISPR-associated protein Cas5/CasD [Spirochaetia bacterium]|nr:type I-E CRISPR-associated protein Cas5/CasD [Spirochaetia bacterium]